MQRIGGIVDHMPMPGARVPCKWFRSDRPHPKLYTLLVKPDIVEIAKTSCGTANKTTSLSLKHAEHALHHRWVEQNIIIQKVNIGRTALHEKEVPLFGKTITRQVPV